MKRLVSVLALVFALSFTTSALAAEVIYQPTRYFQAGDGAGSSFSSTWVKNSFWKQNHSAVTTVTWIDNVSYAWRFTVQSAGQVTTTYWFSSQVKKAHCRSNYSSLFYGSCHVYS